MTKRVLSLLLVLVMVLSLSVPALAAEGEETDVAAVEQTETTPAADEPVVASEAVDEPAEAAVVEKPDNAESLYHAIQENVNRVIQMAYYGPSNATVDVEKDVTIDLNGVSLGTDKLNVKAGVTLTIIDATASVDPSYGRGDVGITVEAGATVNIQSGTAHITDNAGTVNVAGGHVDSVIGGAGTVNVTAGELDGWTAAEKAVLNIQGGKVGNSLKIDKDAKVNISGGEVVGWVAVQSAKATLTMTGGKITGYVDGTMGIVNISDGTVVCANGRALRFDATHRNNLSLSVSGGTFVGQTHAVYVDPTSPTQTHYITGGRFVPCIGGENTTDTVGLTGVPAEVDPNATVAHFRKTSDLDYKEYTLVGKSAVESKAAALTQAIITLLNGPATFTGIPDDTQIKNLTDEAITVNGKTVAPEGTWGKWEAKIGDDKYEYLWNPDDTEHSALHNVRSGETVILLKDVLVTKLIQIRDKNLYIDLNGHILSMSEAGFDFINEHPSQRTRKLTFSGEGDVKGEGSIHSGSLNLYGGNITVELVDTYFHAPIWCESGKTGNKLLVDKDAFLAGWVGHDSPNRFNGSVTVAGRVMGNLYVDAEGEFKVSLESTAVVDKDVYVTGDEGIFTMVSGAVISGNLTVGENGFSTDHRMEIDISGGEVKGSCAFYLERHSNGVISDGVFGSGSSSTTFEMWRKSAGQDDGVYRGVTGGAFAHHAGNNPHEFLKGTTALAVVTGCKANSGYWFAGNSINTALGTVTEKGTLELEHGQLVLASVPNYEKFYVSVGPDGALDSNGDYLNTTCASKPVLKVGYVTISTTEEEIPGTAINTLNNLIAKASNLYGSGKIEEPDQAALIKAVEDGKALKHAWDEDYKDFDADTIDTKNNVQDAIDQLNTILAKYPNADEPEAPWYPADATGWQKNPNTGDIYYFIDGKMQKNLWVYSARKIWYYMGDDGVMKTGVAYARAAYTYKVSTNEFSTKMEPAGWYYFETAADSDAPGRIRGGWHYTADYGWVWSIKEHKGFYGMITWTDKYKGPIPTI